jgi:hypothetical protein
LAYRPVRGDSSKRLNRWIMPAKQSWH